MSNSDPDVAAFMKQMLDIRKFSALVEKYQNVLDVVKFDATSVVNLFVRKSTGRNFTEDVNTICTWFYTKGTNIKRLEQGGATGQLMKECIRVYNIKSKGPFGKQDMSLTNVAVSFPVHGTLAVARNFNKLSSLVTNSVSGLPWWTCVSGIVLVLPNDVVAEAIAFRKRYMMKFAQELSRLTRRAPTKEQSINSILDAAGSSTFFNRQVVQPALEALGVIAVTEGVVTLNMDTKPKDLTDNVYEVFDPAFKTFCDTLSI